MSDSVSLVQTSEFFSFFGSTFPAQASICEALRISSNLCQQLALQNFAHTLYRRLCAAGNKFQRRFHKAEAVGPTLGHAEHTNVAQEVWRQPLSFVFQFPLFDLVLEGERVFPDAVFPQRSRVHFHLPHSWLSGRTDTCLK